MITKTQAKLFRNAAFALIDKHIGNKTPIQISWSCQLCNELHSMNLLDKIVKVVMDYDASFAQPDLALLDQNENIAIAIGIPLKKKRSNDLSLIYTENDCVYIQFDLEKNNNIEDIEKILSLPSVVSLCFSPKCPRCGTHMYKKQIIVVNTECWSCDSPMKIAYMTAGGKNETSAFFDATDLALAESKGVHFSIRQSPIQGEYHANTCTSCGKHTGDFHMHNYYDIVPVETFDAGYYCMKCTEPIYDENEPIDNEDEG